MEKLKVLVLSLLTFAGAIYANPVTVTVAKTAAVNYYSRTYHQAIKPGDLTVGYTENDNAGVPVYFIFNVSGDRGFIIVTAEDACSPIIGSSNTGHYVIPAKYNNVDFWMNNRKAEIVYSRTNKLQATADVASDWSAYINNTATARKPSKVGVVDSVPPLCKTTWDQSPWYNYYCPPGPPAGSGNSVTGCVATAMAQIMKYWQFPAVGITGNTCYEDEVSDGYSENYGQLCAEFDTSHYDWSAMPNSVGSAEYKECAKLMYDLGVSVDMDYSPTGSGAYVIAQAPSAYNSYTQYFNYNPNTINSAMQNSYSAANWLKLIENELNNGRPVQYQGFDKTQGGHSWVCDGYNTDGNLHMNWGWSGYDDGWFEPSSLAVDGYDFDEQVGVIYGIEPNATAAVSPVTDNSEAFTVYPNPSSGNFTFQLAGNNNQWSVEIYNILGQEVYSQASVNNSKYNINLSNQPKGVYVYRVLTVTGSLISTGRLVIE